MSNPSSVSYAEAVANRALVANTAAAAAAGRRRRRRHRRRHRCQPVWCGMC